MKIYTPPFLTFLVRLHCFLVDAAERTAENNGLWLAENEVWIRMACYKTRNTRTRNDGTRNNRRTTEQRRNNEHGTTERGTPAE